MWEDDWFPDSLLKKPITAKPEGCFTQKVNELLKQQGEGWNKELVRDLFSTTEASTILSILVSSVGMIDRLSGCIL